jgi:dTDP-glucose 4,6-dehydratase
VRIIVTGGAGFIGSALVRHLLASTAHQILNIDALGYCSSLAALEGALDHARHRFAQVDITDGDRVTALLDEFQPDALMHLAAESHVDRSIDSPWPFVRSNILGTYELLERVRAHLARRETAVRQSFRFLHVSTDEVFGGIVDGALFHEATPYAPSSPYAASKASADHLVRAWHRTYGMPTIVTNCSNNYGPYQFPEKLIPLVIANALAGRPVPVYGDGQQVRDWLYVQDHAEALCRVLERGTPGATYNIGAFNPRTNLAVVELVCATLDACVAGRPAGLDSHAQLIRFVADRPGHDRRYAVDAGRMRDELEWRARHPFEASLADTVRWYVAHQDWCRDIRASEVAAARRGLGGNT